jgi:ABC-type nitrate/sulfonate/bicarbonate transport system permease component
MDQLGEAPYSRSGVLSRTLPTLRIGGLGGARDTLVSIGALVVVLALWELLVRVQNIQSIYLPAPSAIGATGLAMLSDGSLVYNLAMTLLRIFAGFFLAAVVGVGTGVLMGMSRTVAVCADLFVAALYPLPKISLIPLFIIWIGSGEQFKIAISLIGAVFPVIINTYLGVRQVDPGLVAAARDLGASERQVQLKVVLPASVPSILAGLKLALGVAIIMVVAAEMIASKDGLGSVLFLSGQLLQTERVFVVLVVLALLGIVLSKLQDWLDRTISVWSQQ